MLGGEVLSGIRRAKVGGQVDSVLLGQQTLLVKVSLLLSLVLDISSLREVKTGGERKKGEERTKEGTDRDELLEHLACDLNEDILGELQPDALELKIKIGEYGDDILLEGSKRSIFANSEGCRTRVVSQTPPALAD